MTTWDVSQAVMMVLRISDEQIRQVILDSGRCRARIEKMRLRKSHMAGCLMALGGMDAPGQ